MQYEEEKDMSTLQATREPEVFEFVKRSKEMMRQIMKEKGFTPEEAKKAMGLKDDRNS